MVAIIEGLAMCFLMLLVCVIGITNGPENCAFFYEKDVQNRVVELGLISKEKLKKRAIISLVFLLIPLLIFVPVFVYFVNGTRGYINCFIELLIIYMIEGIFDRVFIDWFWVSKTKAWVIPGTEDLMPYVPKKTLIRKWIGTIIIYPGLAALMALFALLF